MNLLVGLFGGMFLTAMLYGVGRRLGLANFWAAVAAAAAPSCAYLAYAFSAWPGLDAVTIHLVAYPAVAVLLAQLYGSKADHAHTLHWAPKLMIAFFLAISVLYGGFVYIAGQGLPPVLAQWLLPNAQGRNVHTGFAGVVAHHESAAKGIGQHLQMEHVLARLGWKVEVAGLMTLTPSRPAPVAVFIYGPDGQAVADAAVDLSLARPGQKPGAALILDAGRDGYRGMLPALAAGVWVARLHLAKDGETVLLEHTLEVR